MARRRLGLALDRMRAAQALVSAGCHADAVDRAYAAMVQAARAGLALEGLTAASEDDLLSRFRLLYAKAGRIDGAGSEITDARAISDAIRTGEGIDMDDRRARRILEFAAALLGKVGEAIREKQVEGAAAEAESKDISFLLPGASLAPEKEAIVRQLGEAFKGDRRMVLRYLQEFGWSKVVAANIRAVRDAVLKEEASIRSESAPAAVGTGGKNPYYDVAARCLFCGTEFRTRSLRGKVIQTVFRYETPEYPLLVEEGEAPLKGYRFADPLLFAAHVCPQCLFASTSLLHFQADLSVAGENLASALGSKRIERLKEILDRQADRRRAAAARLGLEGAGALAAAFGGDRTARAAEAALELAGLSFEAEAEFLANALFEAGRAYLQAARLSRDLQDGREGEFLGRALAALQDGYLRTTQVAQTTYLLGVLHAREGRWKEARQHLGRILTDRKLADRVRYKVWAENLHEEVRRRIAETAEA